MPSKALVLRPHDVAVALQLAVVPGLPFAELAERLRISVGETHNAVRRLKAARLVHLDQRRVAISSLLDFLSAGVPYAFPAEVGAMARGVPTAHSAPVLAERFAPGEPLVWPSAHGTVRGASIVPLYPGAPELPGHNETLYELLALTDAVRVGQAREKKMALDILRDRLRHPTE